MIRAQVRKTLFSTAIPIKLAASPYQCCARSYKFRSRCIRAAGRITNITQNLWALQAAVPEMPATETTPATPAVPASYYPVPLSWTAGYDNRDRLTSFTRPGASTQYSYDANSNRLSSTDTTTSDTDLDGDFDAADLQRASAQSLAIANDSNRLLGCSQTNTTKRLNAKGQPITSTTSSQVNYGLDAAGNLTSDGLRTFSYDVSNRLAQVQVGDDDEASKVTYLHNAAGQRVFKSEPQVAQTAPTEEQLGADFITWLKKNFGWLFAQAQQNATLGQSYVYGDDQISSYNLLGEYGNGGSKSAGRTEYLYLPTETGNSVLIGLYKNNRFYAVHTDHLGTPRQITDDTNKVVWQWAYSAFGDNKPTGILKATTNPKAAITNQPKLLTATSPSFAVNLRFPGQYFDSESNLSYNYMRSYRPAQGRYDQPDPIGLEGGWSRFGYVGGNPLSFTDPEGLRSARPAAPGGNSYNRRQWRRHGPGSFERPTGEGNQSAWEAGAEMFTPNPDPDEGDYRLRCLRWECSQNSCTLGKSPTDFLPAAYHQNDAPSGCKCAQTNLGPVFNPPSADRNDVLDTIGKYRRSDGQLGRMWRALR